MSKLLFDSNPLVILPELATVVGLNEAIVLQQVHYWVEINRKANRNLRDGYYWTYNSYTDWQDQYPFWSVRTVKRIITSLRNSGLVVVENYNKMRFDRTLWYRIDYSALNHATNIESGVNLHGSALGHNGTMDSDNLAPPIPETTQIGGKIPIRSDAEYRQDLQSSYSTQAEERHKRIKELSNA